MRKTKICMAVCVLAVFVLWTAAVCTVDVRPVGPQASAVGFAALNSRFHRLSGVHMTLYAVTDWLSLIPVGIAAGFAILGLCQWISRKSLRNVDSSLFVLGGFYAVIMAAYLLFEQVIINYRPVLINGVLEASYPSSTTLLALCIMPTAMRQLRRRIRNRIWNRCVMAAMTVFTGFMVIGRLASGVHWLSDIIGGVFLSAGLVLLYDAVSEWCE